jgi:hypothetical protein
MPLGLILLFWQEDVPGYPFALARHTFGNVRASFFAGIFFVVFSLLIGYVVYHLLSAPGTRREQFRSRGKLSSSKALAVAGGLSSTVLLIVFYTALNGFYFLVLEGNIELHYMFPPHQQIVKFENVIGVDRVPSYRSRWRLVIRTRDGTQFESARGSQTQVDATLEATRNILSH